MFGYSAKSTEIRKKLIVSSIKSRMDRLTLHLKTRGSKEKSLNIYRSIDFLPVRNFYMIVETGDYRWLLKGIDYDNMPAVKQDLTEVWENIWQQFIEVSNDREWAIYYDNVRKLAQLESQYHIQRAMIFYLCFRPKKEYIEALKEQKIKIDFSSAEAYKDSLEAASRKVENLKTKIELLQKEQESKANRGESGDFTDLVYTVERFQGFPVDIDKLSIRRFVRMLNQIKKENGKRKD